eukprot:6275254-Amphidinium_carterae.1
MGAFGTGQGVHVFLPLQVHSIEDEALLYMLAMHDAEHGLAARSIRCEALKLLQDIKHPAAHRRCFLTIVP